MVKVGRAGESISLFYQPVCKEASSLHRDLERLKHDPDWRGELTLD